MSLVNQYWAIVHEVKRATSDFDLVSLSFYKPPSLDESYAGIDASFVKTYTEQSAELYGKLEAIIPASIMTKVKSTLKYGKQNKEFACPAYDGVSLIFSIVALYS